MRGQFERGMDDLTRDGMWVAGGASGAIRAELERQGWTPAEIAAWEKSVERAVTSGAAAASITGQSPEETAKARLGLRDERCSSRFGSFVIEA